MQEKLPWCCALTLQMAHRQVELTIVEQQQFLTHTLYDRAWQKKLNAVVKDQQQRAEIYACLWLLINEESCEKFYEMEKRFLAYWRDKQPKFIAYYEAEYSPRTGIIIPCRWRLFSACITALSCTVAAIQ